MIALWMLSAIALGGLLAVAAAACERALRLTGRQGRVPWMFAVVASVGWPLLAPVVVSANLARVSVRTLPLAGLGTAFVPAGAEAASPSSWIALLEQLDRQIALLWAVASALLLWRCVRALVVLHRVARNAQSATVEDTPVWITSAIGPAVFAAWRAHVLLPQWILDLDASLRRMVVTHEREHVRARDPQVVVASYVAVALMPWNAPLWWMTRRLRAASELDCDVRVLRSGVDVHTYGHLLILIALRQGHARFLPMMAGAPNTLRARISAMSTPRPSRPVLRATVLALAAAVALAVAANPALARQLAAIQSVRPSPATIAVPMAAARLQGTQAATSAQGVQPAKVTHSAAPPQGVQPAKAPAKSDTGKAAKPATPMKEFTLDQQARLRPDFVQPAYPQILTEAGITGSVHLMIVVDTTGLVDESSLKVIRASHQLFLNAVRPTLSGLRFFPAKVGNRPVRQLVQIIYIFKFDQRPSADSVPRVKDVNAFEIVITALARP